VAIPPGVQGRKPVAYLTITVNRTIADAGLPPAAPPLSAARRRWSPRETRTARRSSIAAAYRHCRTARVAGSSKRGEALDHLTSSTSPAADHGLQDDGMTAARRAASGYSGWTRGGAGRRRSEPGGARRPGRHPLLRRTRSPRDAGDSFCLAGATLQAREIRRSAAGIVIGGRTAGIDGGATRGAGATEKGCRTVRFSAPGAPAGAGGTAGAARRSGRSAPGRRRSSSRYGEHAPDHRRGPRWRRRRGAPLEREPARTTSNRSPSWRRGHRRRGKGSRSGCRQADRVTFFRGESAARSKRRSSGRGQRDATIAEGAAGRRRDGQRISR
jgi:hypothetical protein